METNNREMIETLLEASLSENYCNTKEFMYEMAKRYRRVDEGYFMFAVSTPYRVLAHYPEGPLLQRLGLELGLRLVGLGSRTSIAMGQRGHVPQYLDRGRHYHECPSVI